MVNLIEAKLLNQDISKLEERLDILFKALSSKTSFKDYNKEDFINYLHNTSSFMSRM